MIVVRAALVLTGVFLFLVGASQILWEIYSWPHQVNFNMRPPTYPDNDTKVKPWPGAMLSSFGATLVAIAMML